MPTPLPANNMCALMPDSKAAVKTQSSVATPAAKTDLLKRVAIALSIANLCFLYVWSETLRVASDNYAAYFMDTPPDREFLWALLVDIVVLGAVVFCLLLLRGNPTRPLRALASTILAVICLFALYQCYHSIHGSIPNNYIASWILRIAVVVIVIFAIFARKRALAGLRVAFLIVSPLFLVLAAHGLSLYYGKSQKQFMPGHAAGLLPHVTSHNRVIWIIFDELDSKYAFEKRPARIQLPHFDALRKISIFSDKITSPARDTIASLPSLLLAKRIPDEDHLNLFVRPIQVRFAGCSKAVAFQSQPNVFQRARALGFNTAVSGWYHPYCRDFGRDLSACATTTGAQTWLTVFQQLLRGRSFLEKAVFLAGWQARALPLVGRRHWISPMPNEYVLLRQVLIDKLQYELKHGMPMLENPKLNFVLLHIPCPHPPGVWDIRKQAFTTDGTPDYIDNLENADRIMGKIRRTLERTGQWDQSTVLVSSDHPYRPHDWLVLQVLPHPAEMARLTQLKWQPYIPFFLKMPGQKTGIEYHRSFNSMLSSNLLLAALQGEIRTSAQAVQWLDAHAAASEQNVCAEGPEGEAAMLR